MARTLRAIHWFVFLPTLGSTKSRNVEVRRLPSTESVERRKLLTLAKLLLPNNAVALLNYEQLIRANVFERFH